MRWRRIALLGFGIAAGAVVLIGTTPSATAQQWRDRDIRHFHDHDFSRWRGGRWFNGMHGGRAGWWWVVGGAWYYYPAPVYPYPDPYVPPGAVIAAPAPVAPPPAVVAPAPAAQYYFCDRPRGYYPYVAACRVPWRVVIAARP